jgi:hypothetical protein
MQVSERNAYEVQQVAVLELDHLVEAAAETACDSIEEGFVR